MTTPLQKPSGARIPFAVDWAHELERANATSIVSAGWALLSGTATLEESTATFTADTSTVYVSGGTPGATQEIVASVYADTGARLVQTFKLFITRGSFDVDMATYYYGVGAAGLNATALALLPSLQATSPIRNPITLSPNAQKCYFVGPSSHANCVVYLSGLPVDMLADRTETVNSVSCRVKETLDLGTWTNAPFETRSV